MNRIIRSTVDLPNRTDIEYHQLPENWDDLTTDEQDKYCIEVAVEHQNNVAPCGADVVEIDDKELSKLQREGLVS